MSELLTSEEHSPTEARPQSPQSPFALRTRDRVPRRNVRVSDDERTQSRRGQTTVPPWSPHGRHSPFTLVSSLLSPCDRHRRCRSLPQTARLHRYHRLYTPAKHLPLQNAHQRRDMPCCLSVYGLNVNAVGQDEDCTEHDARDQPRY